MAYLIMYISVFIQHTAFSHSIFILTGIFLHFTSLQVVYTLLMPSMDPMADDAFEFQVSVIAEDL